MLYIRFLYLHLSRIQFPSRTAQDEAEAAITLVMALLTPPEEEVSFRTFFCSSSQSPGTPEMLCLHQL
jgi:hypothetical protein